MVVGHGLGIDGDVVSRRWGVEWYDGLLDGIGNAAITCFCKFLEGM